MKCEEVDILILDYLENNLDDEQHKGIEKHLESCERCLDVIKESQELMRLITSAEMIKPDESMRINFYHMLHSEIKKSESTYIPSIKNSNPWYSMAQYRIAAGIALLLCGTFLGVYIQSGINRSENSSEINQLHSEVIELKKDVFFTMLKTESSSNRIQAVNYADDLENPDAPVIEVLIETLNNDKNVNVRMAAAYALAKFADQNSVRDSLVVSLSKQVDPILQVTLINILVEMKERSAIQQLERIIKDESTLNEVRGVAENGVRQLI
jgi:hypothetical protein